MSYALEIEYFTEIARRYSNRDDGLDGDFIEEEWQFVRDDVDEDDDDLFDKPARPNFFIDDDEDEDDYDDVSSDWNDGTEDAEEDDDDDNFADWNEDSEDDAEDEE